MPTPSAPLRNRHGMFATPYAQEAAILFWGIENYRCYLL
ncbi:hypothetical protein ADICYQ_1261 [Cyclobacterium qasimii M12-11B]|uniref:Uncharacterized protein n=1 Tax=Cyclobacterium qasimii M12-11B TaxID=641524 RepID=S7VHZ0_9BACT|nr:hypothetical protein ADICYQ_1261 [Cyclobacterium qasimii M12-11B]